jgi:hypothetical protein
MASLWGSARPPHETSTRAGPTAARAGAIEHLHGQHDGRHVPLGGIGGSEDLVVLLEPCCGHGLPGPLGPDGAPDQHLPADLLEDRRQLEVRAAGERVDHQQIGPEALDRRPEHPGDEPAPDLLGEDPDGRQAQRGDLRPRHQHVRGRGGGQQALQRDAPQARLLLQRGGHGDGPGDVPHARSIIGDEQHPEGSLSEGSL